MNTKYTWLLLLALHSIFFILLLGSAIGKPTLTSIDWRPACDGSAIEISSDEGQIVSVHASAYHSNVICEWVVHYIDGIPTTAEYREFARERIKAGDKAGEYSGENDLKKLGAWKSDKGIFSIPDSRLSKDLRDILQKVGKSVQPQH